MGKGYAITDAWKGSKVTNNKNRVSRGFTLAQERNCAGEVIVAVHPLKAGSAGIEHVQGGLAAVNAIKLGHPFLYTAMSRILQHVPLQACVMRPLAHPPEFIDHQQQFLSRLSVHVTKH